LAGVGRYGTESQPNRRPIEIIMAAKRPDLERFPLRHRIEPASDRDHHALRSRADLERFDTGSFG
jgi:hypothetical protein